MKGGPEGGWRLRSTSDPIEAEAATRPLIAQDPVAYSVVASTTTALVEDPSGYESYEWFLLTGPPGLVTRPWFD